MNKKYLKAYPFVVVMSITLSTWIDFIATDDVATFKHYITLALLLANAACYFVKYKQAILITGALLVLATLNLLSFYAKTNTWYVGFNIGDKQITTPEIQPITLFLLLFYCIVNFNFLIDWYVDVKEAKRNKQVNNL